MLGLALEMALEMTLALAKAVRDSTPRGSGDGLNGCVRIIVPTPPSSVAQLAISSRLAPDTALERVLAWEMVDSVS